MSVMDEFGSFCERNQNASSKAFDVKEDILRIFKGVGHLFYIASPQETSFSEKRSVPNYYRDVSKEFNSIRYLHLQ